MALQLLETLKESITAYTGLSPYNFFAALALAFTVYYTISNLFASSNDGHVQHSSGDFEEKMQPLPPPVRVGEITEEDLKQYDGSDPKKPLLMAIKGHIYDVSQSRIFYGPRGPYALFSGKDASRALAKMSFDEKDLNGDLTGLGVFELEALQDWEYKFMGKYVKVGTVKHTVRVSDGAAEAQATDSAETDAAKPAEAANGDTAKPAADGPSDSAVKEIEETDTAVDAEKKE